MKKFGDDGINTLCRSTWNFGIRQLSLYLYKDAWPPVLRFLSLKNITSDIELGFRKLGIVNEERRRGIMLSPYLLDHRESHPFDLPPSQRLSAQWIQETGILSAFTHANPFLYDIGSGQWLLHPSCDPLTVYPIEAILISGARDGVPKNDSKKPSPKVLIFHTFCKATSLLWSPLLHEKKNPCIAMLVQQ